METASILRRCLAADSFDIVAGHGFRGLEQEVRRLDAASTLLGRCALPTEAVGGEATCALGAPVTSAGIGLRFVGGEGRQGAGCSLDSFALW